jgi:hypothetical protein
VELGDDLRRRRRIHEARAATVVRWVEPPPQPSNVWTHEASRLRCFRLGWPEVLEGATVQHPDATLVETIIGTAALCAECLARKTGMRTRRLHDVLPRLIGALKVASAVGGCGACRKTTVVHRLA